ncbi:PP2C family serine/threonine-protein phosphatase [Taibaiella soli]|uniref:PPM-type phosphatase domain-containing protein n=1 Tax=Taibaiella soli TaxID=1649169 RepID=A0A2W2AVA2_9BACT|nr:PP2C family serine/threonine-protein phosphatase [Taibaiella soli]PZF71874.1 hypothetical protein DN068_17620 [Taibaiella soli]
MRWKAIGQSVIGSSHIASGKNCEDALYHSIVELNNGDQALICFVSDGAGSAKYAAKASAVTVQLAVELAIESVRNNMALNDSILLQIAESTYDHLYQLSKENREPKNEFSCTLLGCILLPNQAGFMQIGDGAIVRNDGSNHFTHIFWPHNGEYQNTTSFLIDNPLFPSLKTKIIDETIEEVALFTDGLQMLTLINETETVHQPFFNHLFPSLRKVTEESHISILNKKLSDYLSGHGITSRTDDDKTLFLATKLK